MDRGARGLLGQGGAQLTADGAGGGLPGRQRDRDSDARLAGHRVMAAWFRGGGAGRGRAGGGHGDDRGGGQRRCEQAAPGQRREPAWYTEHGWSFQGFEPIGVDAGNQAGQPAATVQVTAVNVWPRQRSYGRQVGSESGVTTEIGHLAPGHGERRIRRTTEVSALPGRRWLAGSLRKTC